MLENKIDLFFKEIREKKDLDEWYLNKFIDKNINVLSEEDAYMESNNILEKIHYNIYADFLYELIEILLALQRQSNTKELPQMLLNHPNILINIIKSNNEDYIVKPAKMIANSYNINKQC